MMFKIRKNLKLIQQIYLYLFYSITLTKIKPINYIKYLLLGN